MSTEVPSTSQVTLLSTARRISSPWESWSLPQILTPFYKVHIDYIYIRSNGHTHYSNGIAKLVPESHTHNFLHFSVLGLWKGHWLIRFLELLSSKLHFTSAGNYITSRLLLFIMMFTMEAKLDQLIRSVTALKESHEGSQHEVGEKLSKLEGEVYIVERQKHIYIADHTEHHWKMVAA